MTAGVLSKSDAATSVAGPLLGRAFVLWDALPEDLDAATYARILDGTNRYLAAGDAVSLELLYATAPQTRMGVAA